MRREQTDALNLVECHNGGILLSGLYLLACARGHGFSTPFGVLAFSFTCRQKHSTHPLREGWPLMVTREAVVNQEWLRPALVSVKAGQV